MALMKPTAVRRYVSATTKVVGGLASSAVEVTKAKIAEPSKPVLVSPEIEAERLNKCRHECPGKHWREEGNLGYGRCEICLCSRMKHKLAALSCPLGVWKAV